MDTFYRVNAPNVVAEMFDDEAVVVNLQSGVYYSLGPSASLVWRELEQRSIEDVIDRLDGSVATDRGAIDDAVRGFVAELCAEGLVAHAEGPSTAANGSTGGDLTLAAFDPPKLERFDDMQDLLLLDPIHDVDETGWPTTA